MILSMTGFAALEQSIETATLILELRAVNSRYLDLHFKLDDAIKNLEPHIRELIGANMSRGKVECKISVMPQVQFESNLEINQTILEQIATITTKVREVMPESAVLTVAEILRWPNVLVNYTIAPEALNNAAKTLLEAGIADLNATRLREGEKLKAIILERLEQIEVLIKQVKPLMANLAKEYQHKLEVKLQDIIKSFDQERISQELVLFAQRVDVDEELSRMTAHVAEVKRVLNHSGPAGKRLDFLMQELNREANTLGSKSVSVQTTQVSVELKVLIEQMREQVQNIE